MLPIAFCLAQIMAVAGILIGMQMQFQPGDSLLTDVLFQYVPPTLGAYLLYVFYSWMAGLRVWWIGLAQLALGFVVGFLWFNNSIGIEILLMLYFGGSTAILSLLHFQAKVNTTAPEAAATNPTPTPPQKKTGEIEQ